MSDGQFRYDVGLSFAGEQREYVSEVANDLKSRGIHVFFDDFERSSLWGRNLYDYLSEVYRYKCTFCIIFASKEYADKVWTNRERQSAQARAIQESYEYVLPARFDNTPIPGLDDTVHYIDLALTSPKELSDMIVEKLGKDVRQDYLPPSLDRLYVSLDIDEHYELQDEVDSHARSFFNALRRMDHHEREAVFGIMLYGCPAELPDNLHIYADLLRRVTGMSVPRLQRHLGDIRSLGFECASRTGHDDGSKTDVEILGDSEMFQLEWTNLSVDLEEDERVMSLVVAMEIVHGATADLCDVCAKEHLDRLDFSQLASATATEEAHETAAQGAQFEQEATHSSFEQGQFAEC